MTDAAGKKQKPETTAELRSRLKAYETRMDEIADLVARVRHEINNPLTAVLGQAQLLLREELNDKSRQRVQTIEELLTRLRDIVAQLREVQRPVRGTRIRGSMD